MSGMWSEAEAYSTYQGEGRDDDPPAPQTLTVAAPSAIAAAALEEAIAAIREERELSARSLWPGIDRAESVIEMLIQAWKGAAA